MNTRIFTLLAVLSTTALYSQQKLKSPDEFLGYTLGERFSRHHNVVDYFRHVAESSPNVKLVNYGETYEHRPLIYAVVTSPANFADIESIKSDNLKRSGLLEGKPSGNKKAIVWLAYSVHGNEASTVEAAMLTLYELAKGDKSEVRQWLDNTVVIIDPCQNPDGRDRYVNFYDQYFSKPANPRPEAREHREPWPGGRLNHYWYDLNRDWAWLSQVESQKRVDAYHEWMPHIYADFHEQGYNSPYYFAPSAEPMHEVVSPWQREFQKLIGKNTAKHFDEQGWLYFTRELFDLYYPGFGDSYPTYSGAVGMTFEQAGNGSAGLGIITDIGDTLTLKERLIHHHVSGLSVVETASAHVGRLVDEFEKYFKENITTPASPYKTYLIKSGGNADNLERFLGWLDKHKIKYGHPQAKTSKGFDYTTQTTGSVSVSEDDVVISVFQPKSRFITAILEPVSKLSDSLTYDITAWNLMYAYNLRAFALTERINVSKPYRNKTASVSEAHSPAKAYAYLFRYQSLDDVSFLAALLQKRVKVRYAEKPFESNTEKFAAGTLVITKRDNASVADLDKTIHELAATYKRKVNITTTGLMESGSDIGSGQMRYIKPPSIAVLTGEQTSPHSAGSIWHYFEQQIGFPITQLGTDYFSSVDLKHYTVLIVPPGNYRLWDESALEKVQQWVNGGGKLIVMGNALSSFSDKKGFALKTFGSEAEKNDVEKREKEEKQKEATLEYADSRRRAISRQLLGAIYKVRMDPTHPLAFGIGNTYYSLKTSGPRFAYLESGWNVGTIEKPVLVQGFAGSKVHKGLANSLVVGQEPKGRGTILYIVDDPLIRNFWETGKMLFSNAVFMVGN